MKKRTLGLVAGMVLVAASAGFSQATVLDKKADANLSSHSTSEVPAILGSFNNGVNGKLNMSNDGYMEMRKDEMAKVYGEGNVPYLPYMWSGTQNPIVYAVEATVNLGILAGNGGIWVWNQF